MALPSAGEAEMDEGSNRRNKAQPLSSGSIMPVLCRTAPLYPPLLCKPPWTGEHGTGIPLPLGSVVDNGVTRPLWQEDTALACERCFGVV